MDHWWSNVRLLARQPSLTRWLTAHEQTWNLGAGDTLSLGPGTVSVFPQGSGPWKIAARGLRWPLDRVDFVNWHSLSNEAPDGADFTVEAGRFLVIRPLEDTA